jgi:hypothetical protein
MSRPVWFVYLLKKALPQRFWLARLTHLPMLGELVDQFLFAGDDLVYLPMDRTITVNENIQRSVDTVLPSQIVDHFIERRVPVIIG